VTTGIPEPSICAGSPGHAETSCRSNGCICAKRSRSQSMVSKRLERSLTERFRRRTLCRVRGGGAYRRSPPLDAIGLRPATGETGRLLVIGGRHDNCTAAWDGDCDRAGEALSVGPRLDRCGGHDLRSQWQCVCDFCCQRGNLAPQSHDSPADETGFRDDQFGRPWRSWRRGCQPELVPDSLRHLWTCRYHLPNLPQFRAGMPRLVRLPERPNRRLRRDHASATSFTAPITGGSGVYEGVSGHIDNKLASPGVIDRTFQLIFPKHH
jgi:hypothetical protein